MEITIVRSRLLEGLKKVQAASNAKNTLPVLGNVKVEAKGGKLALTSTDLDITLYAEVDCEVGEDGATTIPVRQLVPYVTNLAEGTVKVKTDGDSVRVSSGSSKAKIRTIDAKEFPTLPVEEIVSEFKVKGSVFADLLKKTAYAQSLDDTRRTLKSVLVETGVGKISCVATDGRRLAVAGADVEGVGGETQLILPSRSVSIVQKFAEGADEVLVRILKTQVVFSVDGGEGRMYSRLMDSAFPNYKNVIPKGEMRNVVVDRELLIAAIGRAAAMDMSGSSSVKLTFADGRLGISVKCEDMSDTHDEVPIAYDGEKVEALFNPKYVLDPLRAASSDNVVICFEDGSHPAVIRSESEEFFCVLMPLRVN